MSKLDLIKYLRGRYKLGLKDAAEVLKRLPDHPAYLTTLGSVVDEVVAEVRMDHYMPRARRQQ